MPQLLPDNVKPPLLQPDNAHLALRLGLVKKKKTVHAVSGFIPVATSSTTVHAVSGFINIPVATSSTTVHAVSGFIPVATSSTTVH